MKPVFCRPSQDSAARHITEARLFYVFFQIKHRMACAVLPSFFLLAKKVALLFLRNILIKLVARVFREKNKAKNS